MEIVRLFLIYLVCVILQIYISSTFEKNENNLPRFLAIIGYAAWVGVLGIIMATLLKPYIL